MLFKEKRIKRKHEKKKRKARKELSVHLFSVSAAEQNAPTHCKLKKNAPQEEVNQYLEHRMRLRRKWIDKFFEFHPEIDPKIKKELKKEVYEDIEIFKENLLAGLDSEE